MSEMVERVARAISAEHIRLDGMTWEQCHPKYQEDRRRMARAAIAAMREPTQAMILGDNKHDDYDPKYVWQLMIDEALRCP